jgi:streptomycin 6-kinase
LTGHYRAKGLTRLRQRFGGGTGPFPSALIELAESLFAELLSSSEPPVLIHGDLHHKNILTAQRRGWVAIDPKGLAAEPAYEVGALLRNPTLELRTNVAVQRRRVEVLAEELDLDRGRIVAWGVAQAVLSAWWGYEDGHNGWDARSEGAETLRQLL